MRSRTLDVAFGGCFGALHLPHHATARGVTVVLCPPVGRDARCTYRALFDFAETLASEGFAVLRYDHLGEGDSAPLPLDADRWPIWLAGVQQAATFARAHGGGTRLVLGGLRIGASLAVGAAQSVQPDALMLLAPLASGRAWLRELQVAATVAKAPQPADGAFELDGLRLSRATRQSLEFYDLKRLAPPSAPVWLASPAPESRLAASLGPSVTTTGFPGYAALFREAHVNDPPRELFTEAAAWLRGLPAGVPLTPITPPPAILHDGAWIEEALVFGDGLRGVLTLPAGERAAQGVIFGNTGADPRFGIGSFAAEAARSLAARGVASLRFDFAGLGQSRPRAPGQWRPHIYLASRVGDFCAAADLLGSRGFDDVTLVGICAGGHHALRAAIAEPRFRRVLAINAFLVWRPLLSQATRPARRRVNLAAMLKVSGWRRLLTGELPAGEAIRLVWSGLRRRYAPRRIDAACREVRNGVAVTARRGTQVRVVIGRDDDAFEGLESDFGSRGAWLARHKGVEVDIRPDLDHGLFSRRARVAMIEELHNFVGADSAGVRPRRRTSRGVGRTLAG